MLLHDLLRKYRLILASGSPRRREMLAAVDLPFTLAESYFVDEKFGESIDKKSVAEFLSNKKADLYPWSLDNHDVLVTADTVVLVDNEIFGKPVDASDAVRMLTLLSGKSHSVITGVTIKSVDKRISFSVDTKVKFRELHKDEIEYYVNNYSPFDKAGAYGIQEWIGYVGVESIEGSYFNVVGLPIQKLYVELNNFISE